MGLFSYLKKWKTETSQTPTLNRGATIQKEKDFFIYNEGRMKCNIGGYGSVLYSLYTYDRFKKTSKDKKVDFLKLTIEVLKRDIQSNYAAELSKNKLTVDPATLFPLDLIGQKGDFERCQVKLKDVCVLSFSWNIDDASGREAVAGWYFPELNLALLPNKQRNGLANRLCSAEVTKIELKSSFDSLFTSLDGDRWEKRKASGEVEESCPMLDPRFGLLYELIRIVYGGFSYMDSFLAEYERGGEESRSK